MRAPTRDTCRPCMFIQKSEREENNSPHFFYIGSSKREQQRPEDWRLETRSETWRKKEGDLTAAV